MSFLKNSTSFTRFNVTEDVKQEIIDNIEEKLRQFAFMDIDDIADEQGAGWVSYDDMLDSTFSNASVWKGDFITFSYRVDTRRIAPTVLKKHLTLALRAEEEKLAEHGKKYISKDRKKEINEQVKLRLRTKTLPVPAYFEVVWDYHNKIVYFASTQRSMLDKFSEYFVRTFEVGIEQILPYTLAQNVLGKGCEEKLDELEPTDFNI